MEKAEYNSRSQKPEMRSLKYETPNPKSAICEHASPEFHIYIHTDIYIYVYIDVYMYIYVYRYVYIYIYIKFPDEFLSVTYRKYLIHLPVLALSALQPCLAL